MAWSHMQVNGGLRDHEYVFEVPQWDRVHDGSTTAHNTMDAGLIITWGNDESTGHYIQVEALGDDDGTTSTITVTFRAPVWMADQVLAGVGIGDEVTVQILTGRLDSPDCDVWSLEFVELHVFVNGVEVLIGGFAFLPASGGPYLDSGSDFDDRLNGPKGYGSASALDLTYGTATCSSSDVVYELDSDGQWRAGFRSRATSGDPWEAEPCNTSTADIPGEGCDCSSPLPAISAVDTWDVRGGFRRQDLKTLEDQGARECPSDLIPPGPPIPYDHVYYSTRSVLVQATTVRIASESAGRVRHTRTGEVGCDADGAVGIEETESTTTSQAVTTCASTQSTRSFYGETYCVASGGLLVSTCPQFSKCSYVANAHVSWPDRPDCEPPAAGGGGNLSSTVDPFAGFEYILIREESTGALEFWRRGPDGVNDKFAVRYGSE